jgi:lipid A oxidase
MKSLTAPWLHRTETHLILWCFLILSLARSSRAEFVASVYGGVTFHQNGDLRLQQNNGTDLTFHDVGYKSQNFNSPPYYGARLAYFLGDRAHLGFGIEFFHAKIYLDNRASAQVTGRRGGVQVNGSEPIRNTIEDFSNSHGLNFLTADVIYRWFLAEPGQGFLSRLQPYAGAGAGVLIPHVEATIGGVRQENYQITGPGAQIFGGISFDLAKHLFVFSEYKFSYARLNGEDVPGGRITANAFTHHLVLGMGLKF